MRSMSMVEARLPPGFRFHPRDDELVLDYLCHKLSGTGGGGVDMVDVDLNKCEPWELPVAACVGGKEWYFFSLHDRKYATGHRTNRATRSGYWKATGKDREIITAAGRSGAGGEAVVVGMRKTLVFYQGRAPKGSKTQWVMHEFRRMEAPRRTAAVDDHQLLAGHYRFSSTLLEDWVLCRVLYKTGTGAPARPSYDEAEGSLNSDLGFGLGVAPAPAMLPMAPPPADDNYYGQQDSTGLLLPAAAHQRPPLPSISFRDLISGIVQGSGRDDPKLPELAEDRSIDDDGGYTRQSGMSHTWNPF